jgi:hypothetical protein
LEDSDRRENHPDWVQARVKSFIQDTKVGSVSSGSGLGQAVQGAVSYVTPGDMSGIRSPIRSRLYSAVTPGGRGLRPRVNRPNERGYRCPEGYQFGGRFTDSKWSTCGRQLFDIPSLSRTLLQIADNAIRAGRGIGYQNPDTNPLGGAEVTGASLIQSRMANVPRVGAFDKKKRDDGLKAAIDELVNPLAPPSMMIRRDGFPMQPVVSAGELRKVPDNRNMEGAVFLLSASNIDSFGGDELGLLSNTGVSTLIYVLPNGSTVRMDKTRALTVGERRKLGKTVSSASKIDNSNDPLARLKMVISDSGGGISINKDFSKIRNAEEVVDSGKFKGKPRWVAEAFRNSGKKRTVSPQAIVDDSKLDSETETQVSKNINDIETAIEHINNGGNLSDINPAILPQAIRRAKVYREKNIGSGRTLFQRTDGGVSFIEVSKGKRLEHLGAHFSASIAEHLELPTPKVRIMGEGDNRPYLVQNIDTVIPNGKLQSMKLTDMPAKDLVGIFVSDYLTDVRGRNPSTISAVSADGTVRAVATMNTPSSLAGLSAEEMIKRRSVVMGEWAKSDGNNILNAIKNRNEEVRRQILAVYEDLIQRARAFKWDSYIKQLRLDGKLSSAEQKHMDIVKSLYDQRLDNLSKSKESFANILELGK